MEENIDAHIEFCVNKANEMADYYKTKSIQPEKFPRSVKDFTDLCIEKTKQNIEIVTFDIPMHPANGVSTIRASFLKVKDGYEIAMKPESNFCWKRFVQCKELFHALLDDSKYHTMEIFQHIQRCVVQLPWRALLPIPSTISELMAEIAAVEFLFPYIERVSVKRSDMSKEYYLKIAEIYKIPRVLTEAYLSELSMEYLDRFSRK
jgi:Zn-dependent peptidase ImmA (M78 family)